MDGIVIDRLLQLDAVAGPGLRRADEARPGNNPSLPLPGRTAPYTTKTLLSWFILFIY